MQFSPAGARGRHAPPPEVRPGEPDDVLDLAPVIDRLIAGLLETEP